MSTTAAEVVVRTADGYRLRKEPRRSCVLTPEVIEKLRRLLATAPTPAKTDPEND